MNKVTASRPLKVTQWCIDLVSCVVSFMMPEETERVNLGKGQGMTSYVAITKIITKSYTNKVSSRGLVVGVLDSGL